MPPQLYLRIPLVWITGASTGIGRALALEMVRRGKTVIASARSKDKLQTLMQEAVSYAADRDEHSTERGGRIIPLPLDVTDPKAIQTAIEKIEADYGHIDCAVLNAGGWDKREAGELTLEGFKATYDLNVFGVVGALEHLIPRMKQRGRGHIAITGSIAGYGGLPDAYGYTSGKAALINLAESLAIQLAGHKIKVQIINPGFVRTPLTQSNPFPMPFLMEPQEAAIRIADGLESCRFEIAFPYRLILPMKFMRLFPYKIWIGMIRLVTKLVKIRASDS